MLSLDTSAQGLSFDAPGLYSLLALGVNKQRLLQSIPGCCPGSFGLWHLISWCECMFQYHHRSTVWYGDVISQTSHCKAQRRADSLMASPYLFHSHSDPIRFHHYIAWCYCHLFLHNNEAPWTTLESGCLLLWDNASGWSVCAHRPWLSSRQASITTCNICCVTIFNSGMWIYPLDTAPFPHAIYDGDDQSEA